MGRWRSNLSRICGCKFVELDVSDLLSVLFSDEHHGKFLRESGDLTFGGYNTAVAHHELVRDST